jgi:type I restriction enzyme S subunit
MTQLDRRKRLPETWCWGTIGDPVVATLIMGQSPPGNTYNIERRGLPFFQGKADFGDSFPTERVWCTAPKKIAEEGDILLSVRAPVGPANVAARQCCIGRGLAVIRGSRTALTLYLYYWLKSIEGWLSDQGEGSTFTAIGKERIERLEVPLPPIPVQERIVEILQKADEIRRKRKEAHDLVDKILPSLFLEMFGDPATNPKNWDSTSLAQVLDVCEAGVWGPEAIEENGGYRILRSTNMPLDGRMDFTDVAVRAVAKERAKRYVLEDGDILLNRSSGSREHIGKLSLFRQPDGDEHPYSFSNFVQRLRVKKGRTLPEYLFYFLRTKFARTNLQRAHATSSGLRNINMTEYLKQPILVPPLNLQQHFARVAKQHEATWFSTKAALDNGHRILSSLMEKAFTGELTAEWEAANSGWIAEQQTLQERLPRFLLLALLAEKAKRAGRSSATVLVTALMKYVFLLQMEGNAVQRRIYHFIPYHYGPFAKDLYSDLEKLQEDGLVQMDQDAVEDKIKITLTKTERIAVVLAAIPEDLKQDVKNIIESYGDLDHNALLGVVYEKYPAFTKNSRLKRKNRDSK